MSAAALRPTGLSAATFVTITISVLRSVAAPKPILLGAVALTRYSTTIHDERRGSRAKHALS